MTEPTFDDLRAVLHQRATDVLVPEPPLDAVADADAVSGDRRRRLRRAVAVTAALAAAVTAVVVLVVGTSGGPNPAPPPVAPSRTEKPRTLDELPKGAAPRGAYLVGKTVHLGDRERVLDRVPAGVAQTGPMQVAVWDEDFKIELIDLGTGRTRVLDDAAGSQPVVEQGRNWIAWTKRVPGKAVVVLQSLTEPADRYEKTFPGEPKCCDDPFDLDGFSHDSLLVGSMPAEGRFWVWDFGADEFGTPADGKLYSLAGIPVNASVAQVTYNEIVASLNGGGYAVGSSTDSRFDPVEEFPAVSQVDLNDPTARRALVLTSDGSAELRLRTDGPNPATEPASVTLRLPGLDYVERVNWESESSVILDVSVHDELALVRCAVDTGACKLAGPRDGGHDLGRD